MLLGTAGRVRVAVLAEHLELVVDELGRADLDRVLRLQFVGGGVLRKPKRGLTMRASRLIHNLRLGLGKHDDLLLLALLFGRRASRHSWPSLRVQQSLTLEHF